MSRADKIFKENCINILENGVTTEGQGVRAKWIDGTPAHTIKKFGIVNTYDLEEEFPIITIRPTAWKTCIDELLWIWQKKSNSINELNGHIWDSWADKDGSIGKAYGYQLGIKYRFKQGTMDQVDNVIWQLKNDPNSRRILTNIYNFSDLQDMHLEPCAYSMTFNVEGDRLNGILNQRSQDMLVANNWNVTQYAVLIHMLAQVCGYKAGKLIHVISDAHIYNKHIPMIRELLERDEYKAPVFKMNQDITDFYDFKVSDFRFENYKTGPQIKNIPVAI